MNQLTDPFPHQQISKNLKVTVKDVSIRDGDTTFILWLVQSNILFGAKLEERNM